MSQPNDNLAPGTLKRILNEARASPPLSSIVRPQKEDFMRFASAMTILATTLLASCSSGDSGSGENSVLEKQLVGHWSSAGNDHLYFGETDPSSKIGSYILVHPDGKAFTHRYKIESADSSERTIKANLLFATGDSREETYVISEDGKSIEKNTIVTDIEIRSQLSRVDDTTTP